MAEAASTAVRTTTVHESLLGTVRRIDYNGRTYFHAAGRCIGNHRGDNFDYGVAIVPQGVNGSCWTGFATEAEAIEAIAAWEPTWRDHARDHNHARREAGLPIKPLPLPLSMQ